MIAPRIPDILNMTAASLTAIAHAPLWVVLLLVLPSVLPALARSFNETLASISRFRTESMRRRRADELLGKVTDIEAGLGHLERVWHNDPPTATTPAPGPPTPTPPAEDPPPATPP